jgi:hypothetical protein
MTVPDTFHGLLLALSSNPVFLSGVVYLILGYGYSVLPALTSQAKAAGAAILPFALASGAYVTGASLSYWAWGIEPFYQVVLVAFSAVLGAKLIHSGTERLTGHAAGLFTLIGTQFAGATNIDGAVVGGNVGAVTSNPAAARNTTWEELVAERLAANQAALRPVSDPEPEPEPAPPIFLGGYDLPHVAGPPPTLHVPAYTTVGSTPAPEPEPIPEPAPLPPVVLPPAPDPAPAPQFSIAELEAWIVAKRAAETDRIAASERGEAAP